MTIDKKAELKKMMIGLSQSEAQSIIDSCSGMSSDEITKRLNEAEEAVPKSSELHPRYMVIGRKFTAPEIRELKTEELMRVVKDLLWPSMIVFDELCVVFEKHLGKFRDEIFFSMCTQFINLVRGETDSYVPVMFTGDYINVYVLASLAFFITLKSAREEGFRIDEVDEDKDNWGGSISSEENLKSILYRSLMNQRKEFKKATGLNFNWKLGISLEKGGMKTII